MMYELKIQFKGSDCCYDEVALTFATMRLVCRLVFMKNSSNANADLTHAAMEL